HSVGDLVELAFRCVGLDWRPYVKIDARLARPAEVDLLIGDATKAHQKLGWRPRVTFEQLVRMMVEADLQRFSNPTARTLR
ncbi:GDP-mannose 4,6-dehydratase, partial [Candidatus Sumerlaeota bacterium]|nr:GDP-mannose 4,6-dehydratase [Candidatus Sumerlaeota bacterium]